MDPKLEQFITIYGFGNRATAINQLLGSPSLHYDTLEKEDKVSRALLNFADAATTGSYVDLLWCIDTLETTLSHSPLGTQEEERFLSRLCSERHVLLQLLKRQRTTADAKPSLHLTPAEEATLTLLTEESCGKVIPPEKKKQLLQPLALLDHDVIQKQLQFSTHYTLFHYSNAPLFAALDHPVKPYLPLAYRNDAELERCALEALADLENKTPLLLIEPYAFDWERLLAPLEGHPSILCFHDLSHFLHALQFPEVLQAVIDPLHLVYLLPFDPLKQLQAQTPTAEHRHPLQPILLTSQLPFIDAAEPIVNTLSTLLSNEAATEAASLYALGKRVSRAIRAERLGPHRHATLNRVWRNLDRAEQVLAFPREEESASLLPPVEMHEMIQRYGVPIAPKRRCSTERKKRIAHIVPQLSDSCTDPLSSLIRFCVREHDRKLYEPTIYTTEAHNYRAMEYPYDSLNRNRQYPVFPSTKQSKALQLLCRKEEVALHFDDGQLDYIETAHRLAHRLSQAQVDIVLFHGADPINLLLSKVCDAPIRLFVEHGEICHAGQWEGVILNHHKEVPYQRALFREEKTLLYSNPPTVNLPPPHSKESRLRRELKLPENALLIATASSALDHHLSPPMCRAVEEILRRVPESHFVAIGEHHEKTPLRFATAEPALRKQIHFLGHRERVAPLLAEIDLYLDPIPLGGGRVVVEAMAAGNPVVTLYDPEGGISSRGAGHLIGRKYAVVLGKGAGAVAQGIEGYIQQACELLKNEQLRLRWGEQNRLRVEKKLGGPAEYVRRLEGIMHSAIERVREESLCPTFA